MSKEGEPRKNIGNLRDKELINVLKSLINQGITLANDLEVKAIIGELTRRAEKNYNPQIIEIETSKGKKILVISDYPRYIPSGFLEKKGDITEIGGWTVDEWGFYSVPPQGMDKEVYEVEKYEYVNGGPFYHISQETSERRKKFLRSLQELIASKKEEKQSEQA